MALQATVLTVGLGVFGADMTTEICAINLHMAFQNLARVDFQRHHFTQLVAQHESLLVLAIQITRQLHHRYALGRIHDNSDRSQQVYKVHFARCEDGAGCNAELEVTRLALELAARGDLVRFVKTAARANRFAFCLRSAHFTEHFVGRFFASLVDAAKAKCA